MNSKVEAIRKLRAKRLGDYYTQDEIEAGTEDLDPSLREETQKETDLAPSLKDERTLNDGGYVDDLDDIDESEEVPVRNMDIQMSMQKRGMDQGDAVPPKGMYLDGDENMKGFMGKAARKIKEKLNRG